ncbi:CNNM domain-containing protein, partial [Arthrospira platensis SPKY1]|nr:CNNM domain-containing protein [Arthrospira platensis SPKY1]
LATEPTRFLSTIQVGITLVGILVGAMGEASFVRGLEAWFASHELTRPIATGLAWALMVIMVTYASLIFGELVPKRIALINPERIARFVARPMDLLAQGARPLVWLLSVSTELVVKLFRIRPSTSDSQI